MNIEQEIRAQIEKNKDLKLEIGYINNHLSILEGLLRNERDDVQKQVNEAYQRGLDDAWEAARKIVCDDELGWNTLLHIFNRGNFDGIFGDFSPSEAIAKLKAYEENQKADDEIKVGDEVIDTQSGTRFCVTHFWVNNHGEKGVSGFNHECSALQDTNDNVKKTGRHFDIDKILEEMKE